MIAFFKTEKLGLNITYKIEDHPLGTAGPLSIIENLDENFLVMNGDLLTTIDYNDLYKFHIANNNDVTISTYKKQVKIDLGVIHSAESKFLDYIEKPTYDFEVSMGIYFFNRSVIKYIPKNEKMDIPELILKLKEHGKLVVLQDYYWLDIGRFDDYEKAIDAFREKRDVFLPNA